MGFFLGGAFLGFIGKLSLTVAVFARTIAAMLAHLLPSPIFRDSYCVTLLRRIGAVGHNSGCFSVLFVSGTHPGGL